MTEPVSALAASRAAGKLAAYVPHDLAYDPAFEDALMQAVLGPNDGPAGLRIIDNDSDEAPVASISIRQADVAAILPQIKQEDLPLPLSDPRRLFASPLPGVKLTHPVGYLQGGPGLDPSMDTFSHDFLSSHRGISTIDQLRQAVDQDTQSSVQLLQQRMRARQRAQESNAEVDKEMRSLIDQHNMELKIQRRMLEEHEAKKQAKDKKRREREGR